MAIFNSTYYDKKFRQSPALVRARYPYLFKNAVTGMALCGFVIGVYSYTIHVISQDEFEDVVVPDAPASKPSVTQAVADAKKA